MHIPADLRLKVKFSRSAVEKRPSEIEQARPIPLKLHEARKDALAKLEQEYIVEILNRAGGDIESAARMAGVSRAQLYRLMQRYDIRRPAFPASTF